MKKMLARLQAQLWRIWPLSRLAALLDERDTLKQLNELRLNRMTADEREGWTLEMSHHVVPLIGGALAKQFELLGGTNYVEFRCNSEKLGLLILTLQKAAGSTPHDLKLAAERRALSAEIALKALREKLASPALAEAFRREVADKLSVARATRTANVVKQCEDFLVEQFEEALESALKAGA